MKTNNPFDSKIELQKLKPSMHDAAVELTDTLDLCWAAAQAVFEKKAAPEHALALLPMFMQRADAKRQLEEIDFHTRVGAASKQVVKPKRPPRKPAAN